MMAPNGFNNALVIPGNPRHIGADGGMEFLYFVSGETIFHDNTILRKQSDRFNSRQHWNTHYLLTF